MNHLSAAVHFISWRYHQCSNQSSYKMYWPMFGVRRVDCQHQRFSSYDMCDWPFFRDNSFDVLNNRPPRSFHGWIISHHLASFGPKVSVYMQYNWPPFYILHCIFVFIGMKRRQWWSEVMLRQVCIFLSQQRQPACDVFGINKDSNLAPWPTAAQLVLNSLKMRNPSWIRFGYRIPIAIIHLDVHMLVLTVLIFMTDECISS